MNSFFDRASFSIENDYVEYVNMSVITVMAALLYIGNGVFFVLFAYSPLILAMQTLGILTSVGAFVMTWAFHRQRAASIAMILLVSLSIVVWAYALNVSASLRWYAVLALCPLYFYSSFNLRDKVLFSVIVLGSFTASVLIANYNTPLAAFPYPLLFDTVSSLLIIGSIAFELILYRYFTTKKDVELKRIGTILENVECGISIIDAQSCEVLDVNSIAETIFGAEKAQLIGRKRDDLAELAKRYLSAEPETKPAVTHAEEQHTRPDGTVVFIIKSVAPIYYGGRLALLESFTDVTDMKDAEKRLRLLEVTERANRAKSEFLSRMSHEMRTPMNAIIGMTQIAESTNDVSRLRYCLSTIGVSSAHLLGIINDILDMSKIEAGKLELSNGPLRVERILAKVRDLMADQAERKRIRFLIEMDNRSRTPFLGDEQRLTQVIANLMSNAVKFTPEGGCIRLSVSEAAQDAAGSRLHFSVADTGIGMTEEQMQRLFNAFEQADGSITRQFGGTGLGLAISKSIVEEMGGDISVRSAPGAGSTFVAEVTLARDSAGDPADRAEQLRSRKLLVASPDEDLRGAVTAMLGWHEIFPDQAATSAEAQAAVARAQAAGAPYDVIFLDDYPENAGIELAPRLGAALDTVVLLTTHGAWSQMEQAAREAGVGRFVQTPVLPGDILHELAFSADAAPDALPGAEERYDFTGIRLLLAEDVEINQEIFVSLLADTGIEIDCAKNGQEAMRLFASDPERYDAIIMDIQMPVMNGYEATVGIRAMDVVRAKTIPILALSADAFQDDIEKCKACGMNDHLKKPIELAVVLQKVKLYCGGAGAASAGR